MTAISPSFFALSGNIRSDAVPAFHVAPHIPLVGDIRGRGGRSAVPTTVAVEPEPIGARGTWRRNVSPMMALGNSKGNVQALHARHHRLYSSDDDSNCASGALTTMTSTPSSSSDSSPSRKEASQGGGRRKQEPAQRDHNDARRACFSGERGAEWAGWECTFSTTDGERQAVPEDYVPESLREWDMEIWGFETLTSEQKREETDGDTRSSALYRKRGRVYPEAGCALDNLSLEVNAQTSRLEGDGIYVGSFPDGSHLWVQKPEGSKELRLEAGIHVSGRHYGDAPPGKESENKMVEGDEESTRVRVELRLDGTDASEDGDHDRPFDCRVGPSMTVTREREYREEFDDGALYKGGGLDYQKLRGLLCSKCFGEEEEPPSADRLAGRWRSTPGIWKTDMKGLVATGLFSCSDGKPMACLEETFLPASSAQKEASVHDTDKSTGLSENAGDIVVTRSASYWEASSRADDHSSSGSKENTSILLRGGLIVRTGPWLRGQEELEAQDRCSAAMFAGVDIEAVLDPAKPCWMVEVGWVLEKEDQETTIELLTTVFDLEKLTPLATWRGSEKRAL